MKIMLLMMNSAKTGLLPKIMLAQSNESLAPTLRRNCNFDFCCFYFFLMSFLLMLTYIFWIFCYIFLILLLNFIVIIIIFLKIV